MMRSPPVLWLRALVFNALFFTITATASVLAMPTIAMRPQAAQGAMRLWARLIVGALRWTVGARIELRGFENLPPGGAVIAAKHQSTFDTIVWFALLPAPAYVMKKELLRIPFYGWVARRAGMIPVDRDGGGKAMRGMLRSAAKAVAAGRQVIIFPEGTRTAVGDRVPYLPGVVAIAAATGAPVVPVATDSGMVWGRRSFLKQPGVIRISMLPPLPPKLDRAGLLTALQTQIEAETDRLVAEARQPCG